MIKFDDRERCLIRCTQGPVVVRPAEQSGVLPMPSDAVDLLVAAAQAGTCLEARIVGLHIQHGRVEADIVLMGFGPQEPPAPPA